MSKKPFYKKKRYQIIIFVVLALLVFRLFLPTIVKNYVNKSLSELPGYYGNVDDIEISLWRGAYAIHGMYLNKVDSDTQVPFIKLDTTDISVEWKSLFKGSIVSEIELVSPSLIYVFEDHQASDVDSDMDDWTEVVTDLVPISINRLEIRKGKLAFVQVIPDPTIDLHIDNMNLVATNLQNVNDKDVKLPSVIKGTATSIGNGKLDVNGKMNLLKLIPDMDISLALEDADITALNDMTNHYGKIDFESGTFSIFSEIAIADGYMKSYVKPLMKNAKFNSPEDNFFEKLWEGFVGIFKFILKNKNTDKVATKIPIEGDLNDSTIGIWATVTNLFKNAWFEAFKETTDGNIEFKDAEILSDSAEK